MIKSQNLMILNYLKKGNSVTPIEALNKFGCFRLSGRIFELMHGEFDGKHYKINKTMVLKNGKRFAEYKLN